MLAGAYLGIPTTLHVGYQIFDSLQKGSEKLNNLYVLHKNLLLFIKTDRFVF